MHGRRLKNEKSAYGQKYSVMILSTYLAFDEPSRDLVALTIAIEDVEETAQQFEILADDSVWCELYNGNIMRRVVRMC